MGYSLYWGLTAGAPVFVIGWLLHMLDAVPAWWHNQWIAVILGISVAFLCMYRWVREGYRCGQEKPSK